MRLIELQIPDDLAQYLPAEELIVECNIMHFLRAYYMKDETVAPLEQTYTDCTEESSEIYSDFINSELDGWEEEQ